MPRIFTPNPTFCKDFILKDFRGFLGISQFGHIVSLSYEPRHEKTCFCHIRTTKAQISLRIRGLISAFVIRCLDRIIPVVSTFKISSL